MSSNKRKGGKGRRGPRAPAEISAENAARRAQALAIRTLGRQDDVQVIEEPGREPRARRLDVFELLRTRKRRIDGVPVQSLPEAHYEAIRTLELLTAVMLGQDGSCGGGLGERVDGKRYPPGQNVSQRQVKAAGFVKAWMVHIGNPHAKVLERLFESPLGVLTRWRATVESATGLKGDEAQVAFILTACERASSHPGLAKAREFADGREGREGASDAQPKTAADGQRSLGDLAMDRVA